MERVKSRKIVTSLKLGTSDKVKVIKVIYKQDYTNNVTQLLQNHRNYDLGCCMQGCMSAEGVGRLAYG